LPNNKDEIERGNGGHSFLDFGDASHAFHVKLTEKMEEIFQPTAQLWDKFERQCAFNIQVEKFLIVRSWLMTHLVKQAEKKKKKKKKKIG